MIDAIVVNNVSHSYGLRHALYDISLTVPRSRFTVLIGLNGAGKSTLISLITRLYDTQHGFIDVFGHRMSREPNKALRLMGVVFQARTLDIDLSVRENLLYHAALHGIGYYDARQRTHTVLNEIDLTDLATEKVRRLSGGQMRRVEIARALLHRPRVLILDEPTVGLDVTSKSNILRHVRSLVSDHGVSVLWTTHLLDEIANDDKIIILHHGEIVAEGDMLNIASGDIRSAFARLTDHHVPRRAIRPCAGS